MQYMAIDEKSHILFTKPLHQTPMIYYHSTNTDINLKGDYMRISAHPILDFERGTQVSFTFDGVQVSAYTGETIAAALYAAGYRTLANSPVRHRPRGFFCAIGNCSSCMMVVNGNANVKTCIELVQDGMIVETQRGKGTL